MATFLLNDDNNDDNNNIEETQGIALGAAQTASKANTAKILGAAPVIKEAVGNVVETIHIVIAAKLAETLEAARVTAQIAV